jgi:purine-nucleoside phosphorylase
LNGEERRIRAAASFLKKRLPDRPETVILLGSGLGSMPFGRATLRLPYARIPGFPRPRVEGHPGLLTVERGAVLLRGRAHLYEGATPEEVVRPVRALARAGARRLIVTNAAGSVNPAFRPGDLMVIEDHLNLTGANPLRGGRFVDLSRAYDARLRAELLRAARKARLRLRRGVYAAVAGPSYETPAEVRMLRTLGADAVGMSTAPEVIAAVAEGMRVFGLSVITNRAAGLSGRPLSHEEVLEVSRRAGNKVEALLRFIWRQGKRPPGPSIY